MRRRRRWGRRHNDTLSRNVQQKHVPSSGECHRSETAAASDSESDENYRCVEWPAVVGVKWGVGRGRGGVNCSLGLLHSVGSFGYRDTNVSQVSVSEH